MWDGWLHTGRKKELIITSGGKNLSPANMENDLRQCPLISQAVMYGDRRPYAVALITFDAEEVERAGLSRSEAVGQVSSFVEAVNERYAPPERVRRHLVLDHDFSVEAGDLTPSLKVRRTVVFERYAALFDSLYDN